MDTPLLRDKNVFPTNEVLEAALGKRRAAVLAEFLETITSDAVGLSFEWRFYNDGKSWLGKATHKKKTICWLSVYEGRFCTNFYFTEKTRGGVLDLSIDENIRQAFAQADMSGKMVRLAFQVAAKRQIKDVLEVIKYKKTLK